MRRSRIIRAAAIAVLATPSLWSATAIAQSPDRVLLRQLVGDLALDVRAGMAGSLRIGAADATRAVALTVLATDLRRWADSALRVLAARPPRRGQSVRWEAVVAGPGVVAGSMALARSIAPGDTSLVLLVSNEHFEAVRTTVSMMEARALVGALRKASMPTPPGSPGGPPSTPFN